MFEPSFGRSLAAVTLIGALASTGADVPTEPQGSPARRYSHGGLEIDLPGDWQPVPGDSGPWRGGLSFRSAATDGEIVFIVWLPHRERNYWGSFESFVKERLQNHPERRRSLKRLKVSGLDAVSFSKPGVTYRGQQVTIETRETWIGVPEENTMGTVFRFFTTVEPSGPRREAVLIAYERMLTSMRIDPVKIHRQ